MQKIYIDVFSGITYEELFPMIKQTGFDGFFSGHVYADDYPTLSHYNALAKEYGLSQETSHSTIPYCDLIWHDTAKGDDYIQVLSRNISNCAKLDIPILVVHVSPILNQNPSLELGLKRLKSIVNYAKDMGVKIAFENINSPEYLYKTLDYFNDEHVGFCYDCGHEACHTKGERYLENLGNRIICTHIHDNDNIDDCHYIPFDGDMDFVTIAKELKACDYKGNITLELAYRGDIPKQDFIQKSFDAAQKLKNMINGDFNV